MTLDAMDETSNYVELEKLAECLGAVTARLPDPAAERAAERLLDAMGKTSDSGALERLAGYFGAVVQRLLATAAELAEQFLAMGETATQPERLAGCFGAVVQRLPATAAERMAEQLLDAMGITRDWGDLERLAGCFGAVVQRLPATAADGRWPSNSSTPWASPAAQTAWGGRPRALGQWRRGSRPDCREDASGSRYIRGNGQGGCAAARHGRRADGRASPRSQGEDRRLIGRDEAGPGALVGDGAAVAHGRRAARRPTPRRHGEDQLRAPWSGWPGLWGGDGAAVPPGRPPAAAGHILDAMDETRATTPTGEAAERLLVR